jgi:hypothetical protein
VRDGGREEARRLTPAGADPGPSAAADRPGCPSSRDARQGLVTVNADLARLQAAQVKADAVVRALAEAPDGPHLVVAVTDPITGNRLGTCFVTYQTGDVPRLRLVAA